MQKFIVTADGRFGFGDVSLHRELLRAGESCIGGGFYEFDAMGNRLLLSGRSYDYGRVKWDYIDVLHMPRSLSGMEVLYEDLPLSSFVTYVFDC